MTTAPFKEYWKNIVWDDDDGDEMMMMAVGVIKIMLLFTNI